jgi:hypothetical protein
LIAPVREQRLGTNEERTGAQLNKVCECRVYFAITAPVQDFDLLAERAPSACRPTKRSSAVDTLAAAQHKPSLVELVVVLVRALSQAA